MNAIVTAPVPALAPSASFTAAAPTAPSPVHFANNPMTGAPLPLGPAAHGGWNGYGGYGVPQQFQGQMQQAQFAAPMPLDRMIAQEVNLGTVRELVPPQDHIGLTIAPWFEIPTDDLVFDYIRDSATMMAPARAQDAEATLWQRDEFISGQGRASLMDWALKNHYVASDVATFRELNEVAERMRGQGASFPLTVQTMLAGFQARVARDTVERRRGLDNRIEWLITQALSTGKIAYDDGKIKFDVNFGRPGGQHNIAPPNGADYSSDTHDPLNDFLQQKDWMWENQHVVLDRAYCSRKFATSLYKSSKFRLLAGFGPGVLTAKDLAYVLPGWGPEAAIQTLEAQTGIKLIIHESVMRTRALGSNTFVNSRWFPENQVIFLPREEEITAIDGTGLGFAKTLTSPHPMANWQSGFYAWERETIDPWGRDIGTGVKAFPIFPHMEKTVTWQVTL